MHIFRTTFGTVTLNEGDFLAQGGEGGIYKVPGHPELVAKVFLKEAHLRRRKLEAMLANPPSDPAASLRHRAIAWPTHLLHLPNGQFAGFLMPRCEGQPLANIYHPRERRALLPDWTWRYLVGTAKNFAAAVHALHDRGYIIGDLNESNASVRDNALVTVWDCDSFQVTTPDGVVHRSTVGKPEYTPPELQGCDLASVDRTAAHDRFGLVVLLYQLLMEGVHPFTGRWQGRGETPALEDCIKQGHFHYRPRGLMLPPPTALPLTHLRPALRELFVQAFVEGQRDPQRRPEPGVWQTALEDAGKDLTGCQQNPLHVFGNHLSACPWCERVALFRGRDPSFPSPKAKAAPAPPRPAPAPTPAPVRPATRAQPAPANWAVPALALGLVGLVSGLATPDQPQAQQAVATYLAFWCGVAAFICAALGIRQGARVAWLALCMSVAATLMGFSAYNRSLSAVADYEQLQVQARQVQVQAQAAAEQKRVADAKAKAEADAKLNAEAAAKAKATAEADAKVNAEAAAKAKAEMQLIAAATKDAPWANSLGMKFVPVARTPVLFSVWDTRVQDYTAFATATRQSWTKPSFAQEATHPAVNVSWSDAQAFAKWLTEQERREGKLPTTASYRLPQDWEWSVAVGLNEARGGTPKDKDEKIKDVYPWGTQWPPPSGAGNYSPSLNVDSFVNTSPVGSFAANQFGLYDMGGNVWQWCEDFYDGSSGLRVLRGGSWYNRTPQGLLSSDRFGIDPDCRSVNFGFRLVLVGGALP